MWNLLIDDDTCYITALAKRRDSRVVMVQTQLSKILDLIAQKPCLEFLPRLSDRGVVAFVTYVVSAHGWHSENGRSEV